MESESHKKSQNNSLLIASAVIILLIIVAGGAYYYGRKSSSNRFMAMGQSQGDTNPGGPRPSGRPGGPGMVMPQSSPPELSDQQTTQIADGSSTKTTEKTFNITGGNFYFVPNKITVNKGDKVTFVMTNVGGMHDLVIDELNVKTPVVKTATTVTATFTADKTGSFVFYCDVPGHKEKGMLGTLTVQ